MTWWYLSFAEPGQGFLGGAICEGDTISDAVQSAWDHECNPGGQVAGNPILPPARIPPQEWRNRLLSYQTMRDNPQVFGTKFVRGDGSILQ